MSITMTFKTLLKNRIMIAYNSNVHVNAPKNRCAHCEGQAFNRKYKCFHVSLCMVVCVPMGEGASECGKWIKGMRK